MSPGEAVLWGLAAYAAAGLVFAAAFAAAGAGRIDPVARHAPLAFRLAIVPGAAALWPVMAVKWWRASRGGRGGRPA